MTASAHKLPWHEQGELNKQARQKHENALLETVLGLIKRGLSGHELARACSSKAATVSARQINQLLAEHALLLRPIAQAQAEGITYARAKCPKHNLTLHRQQTSGKWLCSVCDANKHSRKHAARARADIQRGEDPWRVNREKELKRKLLLLDGRPCQRCDYNDHPSILQFHHRDPDTKIKDVSKIRNLAGAQAEAAKCDVLCATCHAQVGQEHFAKLASCAQGTSGELIDCALHGPDSSAHAATAKKKKHCAKCKAQYLMELRIRKKEHLVAGLGGQCVCCKHDRSNVLQFHHLDRSTKLFTIGAAIRRNESVARLEVEAAKCCLVCPNCHIEVELGLRQLPENLPSTDFPEWP